MKRKQYPADLTDRQWARLAPLLGRDTRKGARPRTYPLREVVNALLYVLRGGISWRAIPRDLPPWESVYDHFRRWKRDGTLETVHDALREQVRTAAGRAASPSAVIIDSQSVKTTEKEAQRLRWRQGHRRAETPYRGRYAGSAAWAAGS
jgi:transposase